MPSPSWARRTSDKYPSIVLVQTREYIISFVYAKLFPTQWNTKINFSRGYSCALNDMPATPIEGVFTLNFFKILWCAIEHEKQPSRHFNLQQKYEIISDRFLFPRQLAIFMRIQCPCKVYVILSSLLHTIASYVIGWYIGWTASQPMTSGQAIFQAFDGIARRHACKECPKYKWHRILSININFHQFSHVRDTYIHLAKNFSNLHTNRLLHRKIMF